ncbi:uncharacterized protein LOC115214803 [Octopus sinensis]|uniref:Uncharacterized protein LOC115214803 n=1 Tax=Octopus sinensis TaxID=2607531 RepID=A0A6P7SN35_9MOLL|nr:uncharacterized protein LOC115214803 [Octopus sinensis]
MRFDDASARRKKRSDDKMEPIRIVLEMCNQNLQDGYVPSSCMTVDEQLVSFRGRYPFRVYIPSKSGKYGIKIWAICDNEISYTWKMQIFTGKDPIKGRKTNQGSIVVEDLLKELENTGRNITCDNFFSSLGLDRKLLSKKTTLVGTIRKLNFQVLSQTEKKEKSTAQYLDFKSIL